MDEMLFVDCMPLVCDGDNGDAIFVFGHLQQRQKSKQLMLSYLLSNIHMLSSIIYVFPRVFFYLFRNLLQEEKTAAGK